MESNGKAYEAEGDINFGGRREGSGGGNIKELKYLVGMKPKLY